MLNRANTVLICLTVFSNTKFQIHKLRNMYVQWNLCFYMPPRPKDRSEISLAWFQALSFNFTLLIFLMLYNLPYQSEAQTVGPVSEIFKTKTRKIKPKPKQSSICNDWSQTKISLSAREIVNYYHTCIRLGCQADLILHWSQSSRKQVRVTNTHLHFTFI